MGEGSAPALRMQPTPKLPPFSIESEQCVLGGMMLNNNAIDAVAERLIADDFYRQDHQLIFGVILKLHERRRPVDLVTLTEVLRNLGKLEDAGGLAYIGTIAADTPSAANVVAYADIVRERAVLRRLIVVGGDIAEMAYRPDGRAAAELIDAAEKRVMEVRSSIDAGQLETLDQNTLQDRVEAYLDRVRNDPESVAGLPTGLTDFDRLTTGLHPGDLVILAGRPSMGKTAFAMGVAEYVTVNLKKAAAMFSMEMPGEQLQMRRLAGFARIDLARLRNGALEDRHWDKVVSCGSLLRDSAFYVEETGALTPLQLRAKARRLKQAHNIELLIVDYLQLMEAPGAENRTNEIAAISRGLKALAKELAIPVIALSQLNRSLENRENKRPRMSDLRESGGIEQDADLVVFIYRDEVYNKESADKGTAEIIIAKQRNGALGTVKAAFLGQYTRFENLAQGNLDV